MWKLFSYHCRNNLVLICEVCIQFEFFRVSSGASQLALVVKNQPANAGDVRDAQALGGEDPMEKEMATHSSILGWRIPWRQEPDGLWSIGSQRVGHS